MSIYAFEQGLKDFPMPDLPEDAVFTYWGTNLSGELHPFYGNTITEEHKEAIRRGRLGKKHSQKTKEQMSKSHLGRKESSLTKQRKSTAALNREKLVCPHCQKQSSINMAKRWHFDNCKHK